MKDIKKQNSRKEKQGFSLAEALITLLIVCLITIASIPILTKKKRDPSLGTRGMWICTRNSQGLYVYYDKNLGEGDINNPDTWTPTNKDSCVFTTSRGKQYGITVVGGGGGGGNGESYREVLAKQTSAGATSFSPERTDLYDVIVIAGGGGGGGGQSESSGTGGGGGGGGRFEGFIPLYKGTSYKLTIGGGGNPKGGEYHGGLSNSTGHPRGEDGGNSSFMYSEGADNKTKIVVQGGQGGDSIGCSKWKCRGGDKGYGRDVIFAEHYSSLEINGEVVNGFAVGMPGKDGKQGDYYTFKDPANSGAINQYKDIAGNITTYGNGGDGGSHKASSATAGVSGYGIVAKTWKKFGSGGKAAVPNSYFVPSLEGQVVVTIPDVADAGERGGTVIAINMKGNVQGRVFYGYGGEGGFADETLTEPAYGEHSQFSLRGGGTPAPACTPRKVIPGGTVPVTVAEKTCTKVVCNIIDANTTKIQEDNVDESTGIEVVPKSFIKVGNKIELKQSIGNNQPEDITPFNKAAGTSRNDIVNYFELLDLYPYFKNNYSLGSPMTSHLAWTRIKGHFPEFNDGDEEMTEFAGYKNYEDIYKNTLCFNDDNIKYEKVCADYKITTTQVMSDGAPVVQPAICEEDGGPGTSFGAGGGGGSASDSPGVYSRGGKGGYGAVIIEW